MQVLDATAGLITNYEVYHLLRENHALGNASKKMRHVPLIEAQVLGYITTTPAGTEDSQGVGQFMEQVKKYSLTKAEVLQIFNHCPTTEVELHLIVEQFEERLSPELRAELLAEIANSLRPLPKGHAEVVLENGAREGEEYGGDVQAEPQEEAMMEVEGGEEQEVEDEDNELYHEEELKHGGDEEEGGAEGGGDDDEEEAKGADAN